MSLSQVMNKDGLSRDAGQIVSEMVDDTLRGMEKDRALATAVKKLENLCRWTSKETARFIMSSARDIKGRHLASHCVTYHHFEYVDDMLRVGLSIDDLKEGSESEPVNFSKLLGEVLRTSMWKTPPTEKGKSQLIQALLLKSQCKTILMEDAQQFLRNAKKVIWPNGKGCLDETEEALAKMVLFVIENLWAGEAPPKEFSSIHETALKKVKLGSFYPWNEAYASGGKEWELMKALKTVGETNDGELFEKTGDLFGIWGALLNRKVISRNGSEQIKEGAFLQKFAPSSVAVLMEKGENPWLMSRNKSSWLSADMPTMMGLLSYLSREDLAVESAMKIIKAARRDAGTVWEKDTSSNFEDWLKECMSYGLPKVFATSIGKMLGEMEAQRFDEEAQSPSKGKNKRKL